MSRLNALRRGPTHATVQAQYRRITPEQRADHIENLYLLGQLVIRLPRQHQLRRSFYVMSVDDYA